MTGQQHAQCVSARDNLAGAHDGGHRLVRKPLTAADVDADRRDARDQAGEQNPTEESVADHLAGNARQVDAPVPRPVRARGRLERAGDLDRRQGRDCLGPDDPRPRRRGPRRARQKRDTHHTSPTTAAERGARGMLTTLNRARRGSRCARRICGWRGARGRRLGTGGCGHANAAAAGAWHHTGPVHSTQRSTLARDRLRTSLPAAAQRARPDPVRR